MEMVMCRGCGEFISAVNEDGEFVPLNDECPDCGGAEFKHNGSEMLIRAND